MGQLPATGTEISMGRISQALGLTGAPSAGSNIGLNATLGTGRNRATTVISSIASGSQTEEGASFGGLTSPNTY
jgi:hypothetical protein